MYQAQQLTIRPMQAPDWDAQLHAWLADTDALTALNAVATGFNASHVPKLLQGQMPVEVLGVFVPPHTRAQVLLFVVRNALHRSIRLALGVPPGTGKDTLAALLPALPAWAFAQQFDGQPAAKLSVLVPQAQLPRLQALLPENEWFLLEGRLRQEWCAATQALNDVWLLSAFPDAALRPAKGSVQLPGQSASPCASPLFADWPPTPPNAATRIAQEPVPEGPWLIDAPHHSLRSLRARDASEAMLQWFTNTNVLAGMNLAQTPKSLDGLRAFLAGFDQVRNHMVGVFDKADGSLQGFYTLHINESARVGNLALCMNPALEQSTTVMTETITPLTDAAFRRHPVDKITGNILVSNRRMMSLVFNNTFVLEGHLRQECTTPGGGRADALMMSTFRDRARRPKDGELSPTGPLRAPV